MFLHRPFKSYNNHVDLLLKTQQNPHNEGLHAPSMCRNSPVTKTSRVSPFISRAIAQPLLQFTDPRSLLFHVQLWNSHPARRHLTRAPAIYGKFPKNTDSGRQTAIFVNSARESPTFSSKTIRMANRCSSDLKTRKQQQFQTILEQIVNLILNQTLDFSP